MRTWYENLSRSERDAFERIATMLGAIALGVITAALAP